MVATTDRYATEVGIRVLREGGNAVDAAVAVSFALAVVNPEAGNIGGGGFMVLRSAEGEVAALDYRSCAPEGATPEMYLGSEGQVTERSVIGPLAAGVPGSVGGLWEAHQRRGRLPWPRLVDPAISLAEGFTVRARFLDSFEPHIIAGLSRFPETARIFLPDGSPPPVDTVFCQPDLARALERIRDLGQAGFYEGETADLIEAEMRRGGGIITREDLGRYRAEWRTPLDFSYRGHRIVSMPPSSSGGVALAEIAGILSQFDIGGLDWHGPQHIHLLAEAFRRAFADRNHYLADPSFAAAPVPTLTSVEYGRWRAQGIAAELATPSARIVPGVESFEGLTAVFGKERVQAREGDHTTHISIVDPEGNAASVTTTVNTWYGSKAVVPGAGFLLNNEMDDFTAKPGIPNFFGLVQGKANIIAPGKRSLSAMTPTLILRDDGALHAVIGTPGGATIITTVFQLISNLLDHEMTLGETIDAPRIHHQHLPDRIDVEPHGLLPEVIQDLQRRGHVVQTRNEWSGDAQGVIRLEDGTLEGGADPRRGGHAAGF